MCECTDFQKHEMTIMRTSEEAPAGDCTKLLARRKTVSLTLTHSCNLECVYCYEGFKNSLAMPLQVAKDALVRHFAASLGFDEIEIDLGGGEPFLAFDTMRQLCEWFWSHEWSKPYICFATTNGTLVHGKVQDWVHANRDRLWLSLSIDGTPDMHNLNRSGSFSRIDVDFFRQNWPSQPVKMTVSRLTLGRLAEGVQYLHGLGFGVQVNLAYGVQWSDPTILSGLSRQLVALVEFYVHNPEVPVCTLLSMEIGRIDTPGDEKKKWCGVGTDMVAVDTDGSEYPCHLFQPISMGERAPVGQMLDFSVVERLLDPCCGDCPLVPICPTCYGANYLETGTMWMRNRDLCKITKMRALACSYLQARRILSKTDRDLTESEAFELHHLCRAIKVIQNRFGTELETLGAFATLA